MRQFETEAAPSRDIDAAIAPLVRADLEVGEAVATAIRVREAMLRLGSAHAPAGGSAADADRRGRAFGVEDRPGSRFLGG